ncbi:hypothetical protein V6N12_046826 [Hibiscus sabdariffa]|uniref:Uncharacterized protein n=1 Tax=Hibiscus sabdariffa TaxID=183260 RepID=A0ABR2AKJ9_9ROSI
MLQTVEGCSGIGHCIGLCCWPTISIVVKFDSPPSLFSDRRENQGLIAQRNRKSSISSNVFPPLTRSDSVVERPLEYSSDEGYGDDDDNNDNDDDDDEDE